MRSIALFLALLPALVISSESKDDCSADSTPLALGVRHNVTLSSSNRTYMYFLPEKYDQSKSNPLILSFHGASRTSDWQADLDQLTDPFFNDDHVVVYPQAEQYGNSSTYIYWQGSPNATADDVGYVGDVLDDVEGLLSIDKSRVYATGKSQGGGMVGVLACDPAASQRIAAFAPVSGAFYTTGSTSSLLSCDDPQTLAITCNPGRAAIPILDFHGGNDTTISINGGFRNGGCLPAIRHWVAEWVERNNLTVAPSEYTKLNGSAQGFKYGEGKREGLVTFVYDGDHVNHDWPATFSNSDNLAHGSGPASFNASSLIMAYFAKYTLPNAGNASTTTVAADSSTTSVVTAPFTILTSTTTSATSATTAVGTTSVTTTTSNATGTAISSVPTSGAYRAALSNLDGISIAIGVALFSKLFLW